MATSTNTYRPGRQLIVFVTAIIALYVIMATSNTWKPLLGLDLQGGTSITLTAKATSGAVTADSLEQARQIIERRVDGMGVSEATVTTQSGNQIVITAPGFNQDALVEQVGRTAQLEFRQVYKLTSMAANQQITEETPIGLPTQPPTKTGTGELLGIDDVLAWEPSSADLEAYNEYQCGAETASNLDQPLITCNEDGTMKYLLGPVAIEGKHIDSADASIPQNEINWVVLLKLSSDYADDLAKLTENALSYQTTYDESGLYAPRNMFAIVIDDKVVSAPGVNDKITDGSAMISGNFTMDSAQGLANVLKYGALPLSFESSDVQNISASLGQEQLEGGLIAAAIGLSLVLVFSLFYYRGLSIIVVGSLGLAAAMTYAMLALLGTTMGVVLTLPGLAGAVVSIGTTADSFIIYFERIRDEIREGRSLKTSIETGWRKARGTVVVSDAVQLLSAVVLFLLAAGNVKGFAFILALTTVMDLLIVFFFTHPLMTLLGRTKFYGHGHKMSGLSADHMGVSLSSLLGRRPGTSKNRSAKLNSAGATS